MLNIYLVHCIEEVTVSFTALFAAYDLHDPERQFKIAIFEGIVEGRLPMDLVCLEGEHFSLGTRAVEDVI